MNPLLGICIPTYNRAEILKQNLENLTNKISKYKLPIYISDNNSSDNTGEVVAIMQKEYPYIFYSRNSENVGSAKNFELVLSMCDAKYAWLLGDDDIIIGDMNVIFDILEQDEWDFIVMGIYGKIGGSKTYNSVHNILTELLGTMTWLSALIINKEMVKKMIIRQNQNQYFAHTGALIEALENEDAKVYYYYDHLIVKTIGTGLGNWANQAFEIFSGHWIDFVLSLPNHYTLKEKKKAILGLPTSPWRWRILLVYRLQGFFNYQMLLKQKSKISFVSKRHYIVMACIAILPKFIISIILNSGLKIKETLRKIYHLI